jgi:hypothetical protein
MRIAGEAGCICEGGGDFDRFFEEFPDLARGLLYFLLFWGEQQAVVALVTAACNFFRSE